MHVERATAPPLCSMTTLKRNLTYSPFSPGFLSFPKRPCCDHFTIAPAIAPPTNPRRP